MAINKGQESLVVSSAKITQKRIFPESEKLPDEIESESLVHKPRTVGFDNKDKFKEIYNKMSLLISNFDEKIKQKVDEIPNEELKNELENFSKLYVSKIGRQVKKSEFKITSVCKEKLIDKSRDPTVIFTTWKHYKLAKFFFEGLEKAAPDIQKEFSKMNQDEFNKYIEEGYEDIELGAFLASEPISVICAFYADRVNDIEFIMNYSDLVDRFTHKVARESPKRYKDLMSFNREIFNENEVSSIIDNLHMGKGAI